MTLELGGPGVACSTMRVRRFEAGELRGEEAARTEAHLDGCARCQETLRELARERALLARDLPFETMAAGVAERLARSRPRPRAARVIGMAIAAGLAAAVAVPALLRTHPEDETGVRLKGGAELTLFSRSGDAATPIATPQPVPPGAALRIGLSPGGRKYAAVALLDADGAAVLYAGEARAGVLPGAFEWTGSDRGTLVAVLADEPIDPVALAERLARDGTKGATPGGDAEVIVRPLERSPR